MALFKTKYTFAILEGFLISTYDSLVCELETLGKPNDEGNIVFTSESDLQKYLNLSNRIYAVQWLHDTFTKYEHSKNILLDIQNLYIHVCDVKKSDTTLCKLHTDTFYTELTRFILLLDKSALNKYDILLKVHELNKK